MQFTRVPGSVILTELGHTFIDCVSSLILRASVACVNFKMHANKMTEQQTQVERTLLVLSFK